MALFSIRNLTFTYPSKGEPAIKGISLSVESGEFITICGKTGCGKSTLLRNLKTVLTPHGTVTGEIDFDGSPLSEIDLREQTQRIGFVMQNPDNQIVTDKVWHELAFGLESLGYDTQSIRLRVAEMASFFGIHGWFMKNTTELSGGQKQLLNLAAIMTMQPDLLILDEPTAQLDPIAASEFLDTIKKINREIGTTIIMTEHRLEEILPMSDRIVVLDKGSIAVDGTPHDICRELAGLEHHMFLAIPGPMQIYAGLYKSSDKMDTSFAHKVAKGDPPLTVRDGRRWLTALFENSSIDFRDIKVGYPADNMSDVMIAELKDVWFKYDKNEPDVLKGLSLKIQAGMLHCIVGGNGTGKTTALSLLGGIYRPYRGKVIFKGREIWKYKREELFNGSIGMLPQNPQTLFVEKTVELDLLEILDKKNINADEKKSKIRAISELMEIEGLLNMHPYDLSGGEQQRVALGKILLLEPEIILLDEPTKGLDNHFKAKLADIIKTLLKNGKAVVMVSHDIEFCAQYGDQCSLCFDGDIVSSNNPNTFFSGNSFYTTASNRMSRHIFNNAVTTKDVIDLCIKNQIMQKD